MNSKLIPPNPSEVTVIRRVTPNITTLSAPFLRFGRIKIGGRGTIVRLSSGATVVFSPVALTPQVREAVQSLGGNVRYLVALDIEHHMFLGQWYEAYPGVQVIGPEGLPEKRATQKNENIPFSTVFTNKDKANQRVTSPPGSEGEFDRDFDYEYVGSHANKELVFLYKPDRTVIEADMMFNLPATEQYSKTPESATSGFLTRLFTGLNSTYGDATWQKRFLWYVASSGDRPDFNASAQRIAKWDFDRIIPCHGDVIETGAKGIFQKVFAWHLSGHK
ncbi:MAG: hypothetical protein M4579_000661 [Chaenotheca gracillima]|nr:MAG: hypothetical protein M4579_000661 [Chaenotheca gracillima]